MPSATFTHVATAHDSAEAVWIRLQRAETWADIGPVQRVWDAVHDGDSLESYRWETRVGPTRYEGTAEVKESLRPRLMYLVLDAGEVRGTLTTELSPDGEDSTAVSVTMVVESRGMLSTMFFPVISEAVGNGLPAQVERFVATASSG